jgi:hypothetical protein
VTSEAHLIALAGGSGFAARIHARGGNQKQLKQLGFNRILDPYSIGTEKAQNILQVAEKKGWLPGMDSNHDSHKFSRMCNLQILKRPRLPNWTRNAPIGTAPVQSGRESAGHDFEEEERHMLAVVVRRGA